MAFIPSEQFWLEQRVDQINEQPSGHQRSERVVKDHDPISSELFAGVDIRDRQREKADCERDHHDVHHGNAPNEILKSATRCLPTGHFFDLHQKRQKRPAYLPAISARKCIGIRDGKGVRRYRNSIKIMFRDTERPLHKSLFQLIIARWPASFGDLEDFPSGAGRRAPQLSAFIAYLAGTAFPWTASAECASTSRDSKWVSKRPGSNWPR